MPISLRTPSGTSPYNLPLLQGNGDWGPTARKGGAM